MGFMSLFKEEPKSSANVAKERLQVLVAHERNQRNAPDYLPAMQRDILAAISKYVNIDMDDVQVQVDQQGQLSMLEVNVTLPS